MIFKIANLKYPILGTMHQSVSVVAIVPEGIETFVVDFDGKKQWHIVPWGNITSIQIVEREEPEKRKARHGHKKRKAAR